MDRLLLVLVHCVFHWFVFAEMFSTVHCSHLLCAHPTLYLFQMYFTSNLYAYLALKIQIRCSYWCFSCFLSVFRHERKFFVVSCLFQTKILQRNWNVLKWKFYKETESCFYALVNGISLTIVENDNTVAYTKENWHELLQFPVSWTTYGELNRNWTTYGELNWNCRFFGIYTLFP